LLRNKEVAKEISTGTDKKTAKRVDFGKIPRKSAGISVGNRIIMSAKHAQSSAETSIQSFFFMITSASMIPLFGGTLT
jgi:hypothetical protein